MAVNQDFYKEIHTSSIEQLLVSRLDTTMRALEIGDGDTFDRSIELIEMLTRTLKKGIYNDIINYKKKLLQASQNLIEEANKQSSMTRNEIQKRAFIESARAGIIWDLRNDYLEYILSVLGKNQMIPMETSEPATFEQDDEEEYIDDDEEDYDDEIDDEPEPIPQPKPIPKKQPVIKNRKRKKTPRLSINTKNDEDFDL